MTEKEVLKILKETGAFLEGHFLLSSGLHTGLYLQCAVSLQYPRHAERLAGALAERFSEDAPEVVIGPALGGVVLAQEVGRALGVRAIFSEREGGLMRLRRGFKIKKGERVLVVEDVVTTGGSVKEVIGLVGEDGGVLVGVGSLVDRSGGRIDFGVKSESLLVVSFDTYDAGSCPYCASKQALTKPGSRQPCRMNFPLTFTTR